MKDSRSMMDPAWGVEDTRAAGWTIVGALLTFTLILTLINL